VLCVAAVCVVVLLWMCVKHRVWCRAVTACLTSFDKAWRGIGVYLESNVTKSVAAAFDNGRMWWRLEKIMRHVGVQLAGRDFSGVDDWDDERKGREVKKLSSTKSKSAKSKGDSGRGEGLRKARAAHPDGGVPVIAPVHVDLHLYARAGESVRQQVEVYVVCQVARRLQSSSPARRVCVTAMRCSTRLCLLWRPYC
jgi:hypothetical protein